MYLIMKNTIHMEKGWVFENSFGDFRTSYEWEGVEHTLGDPWAMSLSVFYHIEQ